MRLSFYRYILLIASIVFAGWAGLRLALPPGYASPIWPPAGIALAAVLLWGKKVWPAIGCGSFLTNLSQGYDLSGELTPPTVFVAMGIAIGSTLQALTGAWLSQRFLGTGVPRLDKGKNIFRYVLLVGPLTCLIAATVGVSTLLGFGVLTDANVLVAWWNWWIGDCLGAIIISPLVFCLFAEPRALWRPRLVGVAMPLVAMLAGLIITFLLVLRAEDSRLQLQFDSNAGAVNKALADNFSAVLKASFSLNSFFQAAGPLDRDKFGVFANGVLTQNPHIQALSWVSQIPSEQRASYEQSIRDEGYKDFTIKELGADRQFIKAQERTEYFPVTFIEPLSTNKLALGFDLNSEANRRAALTEARASQAVSVTRPIQLVQDGQANQALLLMMPVYLANANSSEPAFSGFLSTVVRIDSLVKAAMQDLNLDDMNVALLYYDAENHAIPLYGALKALTTGVNESRHSIRFGNRLLEVIVQPEAVFIATHASWLPWLVLLGGLLFTMLLSVYLLSATGRAAMVAALVDQRTAQLDAANSSLKDAYIRLAEKGQKLRDLYELSPLGIALLDVHGKFVEFNHAFQRMTGYTEEELQRLDYMSLSADKEQSLAEQLSWLARTGQYGSDEATFIHKRGRPVSLQLSGTKVAGTEDQDYIWFIAEDVTQAKANKEVLRQSELKYRKLFNSSSDAVMMADSSGFLDCNQATLDLFGYDAVSEFCRLHPGKVSPPNQANGRDSVELANEYMATAIKNGHLEFEWLHKRADGRIFPALVTLARVSLDGHLVLQSVVRDLSEQKRVEQALIEAKETAESMAAFKSEFLANMSHEIRTPMNAVIGLSQLALNKPVSAEVRDYLQKIYSSSVSLLGILNDILDFSKMEAGKLGLEQVEFNLNTVLDNLHNLFALYAAEKCLDIKIDVAPDVPLCLVGDALRLQQILSNLVGNALKFTEQGSVTLQVALLEWQDAQAKLRFSVMDTGIGIPEADLPKLFRSFSQLDASITRRFGGTGLGLSISQKLLQLMGSDFHVESKPGQGSNFSFDLMLGVSAQQADLPAARPDNDTQAGGLSKTLADQGSALRGMRILVAEDHAINQKILQEFLALCGVSVDLAGNGRDALAMLAEQAYDAVLMDIHMPVMSGLAATEQIRRNPEYQSLPIIALSAGVTQEERDKCLASGMNEFVVKPIQPMQLVKVLCQQIGRSPVGASVNGPVTNARDVSAFCLRDLPGFDFSNTLDLLDGDESFLSELLGSFKNSTASTLIALDDLLEKRDLQKARDVLHGLKGVAANLGANRVEQAATRFCLSLKQDSLNPADYAEFKRIMTEALTALEPLG
ncbi:CHASE domain-containing protein [Methylomonas sp. OY6]|uniref:histidine kinase n=1 Tax=Methylomonas defluvii TaxID=3045149 RepID=A0ABU4U8H4_9GAMM|nr:CHASE domain-containing protein [Methylomonas sp. OY6]MDX8125721.1 CHASE domain-containing protein [Methylomonas sp. OY6]